MRLIRALLWISILVAPVQAVAVDADYKFCSIAGYGNGLGNVFLGGLAVELAERQGIFSNNSVCSALYRNARDAAIYMDKNKAVRGGDQKVIREYAEFEQRIQNAILKSAGY
jgi:hypothetical protein